MRAFRRLWALGAAGSLVAVMACGGGEAERETADETEAMGERQPAAQTQAQGQAQAGGQEQDMQAAQDMDLPEGVTAEMVQQGREVFTGDGLCYACHAQDGSGLPNLGANLTDGEWVHIDGSYESIIQNINEGVTAEESTSGTPMPPRGGAQITDEQVRAAAAYVWTLSN